MPDVALPASVVGDSGFGPLEHVLTMRKLDLGCAAQNQELQ